MTPAVFVVEEADAVHEAGQQTAAGSVEQKILLTITGRRTFTPPPGTEALRRGQGLAGIPVPIHLEVNVAIVGAGLELEPGVRGERHREKAIHPTPRHDRQPMSINRIPTLPVHDTEEIAEGRFDLWRRRIIEIDAQDHVAGAVEIPARIAGNQRDVADAAGPVQLHDGLPALPRDTARDLGPVRHRPVR